MRRDYIIKNRANLRGVVTTASIRNTSAIGAAIAFQREEITMVLSAINFLTLLVFHAARR
ncbi:hypothetical protein A6U89_28215 [Agrobacterium sp. B133/95]|nr:hypothetical protein A6U88_33470 [Agrobacterium sp. B131/95]OCJ28506.1 hypothetical protein A6U89_28215 [Agrobacterium sp. B133/95]